MEKSIGASYTIEWDRGNHSVTILHKGKRKRTFQFDKFYKAVDFYANLKKVKDVKELL